jgi:hypothetical protein
LPRPDCASARWPSIQSRSAATSGRERSFAKPREVLARVGDVGLLRIGLDVVELADQVERFAGLGEGRLALEELPPHMSPAVGEREARTAAGSIAAVRSQGGVGAVAIAHDDAAVRRQDLRRGARRAAGIDAVEDGIGRRHRPGVPALGAALLEQRPRRLVGADHRRREHVGVERFIGRGQRPSEAEQLIPQRLGVDGEPGARHLAHLASEREMVEVLGHGDAHREVERVAAAGHELGGAERGLDAAAAAAGVLLALVADHPVAGRDDVDLAALLVLALPRAQRAAAGRAGLVGGVERVDDLDDRQGGLGPRPMTAACGSGSRRLLRVGVRGRGFGSGSLLRGAAEEPLVGLGELLLQAHQLELERSRRILPAQQGQLRHELADAALELLVLLLLEPRHLAQHLGTALAG